MKERNSKKKASRRKERKIKKDYADNTKISSIYVVREMLGFRSD